MTEKIRFIYETYGIHKLVLFMELNCAFPNLCCAAISISSAPLYRHQNRLGVSLWSVNNFTPYSAVRRRLLLWTQSLLRSSDRRKHLHIEERSIATDCLCGMYSTYCLYEFHKFFVVSIEEADNK